MYRQESRFPENWTPNAGREYSKHPCLGRHGTGARHNFGKTKLKTTMRVKKNRNTNTYPQLPRSSCNSWLHGYSSEQFCGEFSSVFPATSSGTVPPSFLVWLLCTEAAFMCGRKCRDFDKNRREHFTDEFVWCYNHMCIKRTDGKTVIVKYKSHVFK